VVVASHDREFLDAATNRTLFLRPEQSHYFALPFSAAREALRAEDEAAETKQQRELREAQKLRQQSAKLSNIGINSGSDLLTVKAKQLKERAAAIERNIKTLHKARPGDIRLAISGTHAKVMVEIDNIEVTTPSGMPLFKTGRLYLFQGDRLVLLGLNGAGKSQMVRLLHQAITLPDSVLGIRVSPTLALGYSDQSLSHLPPRATPTDILARFKIGDARTRALLAGAGLAIEKQNRPLTELSFGQRSRLSLLALRLSEPNFYLLDEPTNHIDIAGQERLEAEILEHQASSVLVSHDRRFVANVGTRFLEITKGRAMEIDDPEIFFARIQASVAGS
jgi:ATPase subunit of ABC transporter with duplicated ATPase domains